MIEFIQDAFRALIHFGEQALVGANLWILSLIALIAVGVIAAVRGKLTESWLWIPMLALGIWYAVFRWLETRR